MENLVVKGIMVSVVFIMWGVGLGVRFRDVIAVAKQYKPLIIGIIANFIIFPVLVYIAMTWLPLSPLVKVGIMLMVAAPIAPMVPLFVNMAKGDLLYSVGLMVIVALLSVIFTPLILGISFPDSIGGVLLNPLEIVKTLIIVQIIPISVGMIITQKKPKWSKALLRFVPKIGQIGLFIGVVLILVKQLSYVVDMGLAPHLVFIVLSIISLFIGDWMLIKNSSDKRRTLAVSTAIRNVPLAFLIAGENFPDSVVTAVVLIYSIYTMLVSMVYGKMFHQK